MQKLIIVAFKHTKKIKKYCTLKNLYRFLD